MLFFVSTAVILVSGFLCFTFVETKGQVYYIVILRWPAGSRMLHQNTAVIRRLRRSGRNEGCDLRFVRAMSPKLGQ